MVTASMMFPKIEILPKIEQVKDTSKSLREELLHLLSVSATLSGLCITAVALMHTLGKNKMDITIVDDMFAICSLLFLFCIYLIFFTLRVKPVRLVIKLSKFVDTLFLFGMTTMTLAAFLMVYTVW
jgi:hypothetical protein